MLEDELTLEEDGAETEIYNPVGDLNSSDVVLVPEESGGDIGDINENADESIPLETDLVGEQLTEDGDSDLLIEDEEEDELLEEVGQPAEVAAPAPEETVEDATEETSESEAEETSYTIDDLLPLVEVIGKNQKVAAENMQLIGAIQIALLAMLFGGFVIYCFLHKLW